MSAVEDRLAELGLTRARGRAAGGGLRAGRARRVAVYTSGQLPMVAGTLAATGKVGEGAEGVAPTTPRRSRQTCALNAIAAVKSVVGDLDQVDRVVKVVGFVACDPDFTGQPGVVNGASELLGTVFGDAGVHARSAVGVAALPLDAPVEVEIIVDVRD